MLVRSVALVGFIAVALIGLTSGRASATTINNLGPVMPNEPGTLIAPGSGGTLTSSNNAPISMGQNSSNGTDPWGVSDSNSQWLSVGACCGGAGSFATFSFATSQTVFTLLWGSPNSDNTVTLYSGTNGTGIPVATVSFVDGSGFYINSFLSSTPYGPNTIDPGDLMSIDSSAPFLSAVLTNDIGGFEVADVSGDPTPLPPTWVLMLGGLIGLAFIARRGSRQQSVASA